MDLNANKRQIVEELHEQAGRYFKPERVVVKGTDDLWQADLVEMLSYETLIMDIETEKPANR